MKTIDGGAGREGLLDLGSTRHSGLPVTESPSLAASVEYASAVNRKVSFIQSS